MATKTVLTLSRQWYSLQDAAEKTGFDVDDLIDWAATGKIQLYVLADGWVAGQVYAIDNNWVHDGGPLVKGQIDLPDLSGDDAAVRFADYLKQRGMQDEKIGAHTFYAKRGIFGLAFDVPLKGPKPVAAFCISQYYNGESNAKIEFDVNVMLNIVDPIQSRFLRTEPEILVADVLQQERLVIMSDDLKKFIDALPVEDETDIERENSVIPSHTQSVNDLPAGLNNHAIAIIFDDFLWDYEKWKKNLSDPPIWLSEARMTLGRRGGESATWNPVYIACYLQDNKKILLYKLNNLFLDNLALKPWIKQWEEFKLI